jgi:hypothetical protein
VSLTRQGFHYKERKPIETATLLANHNILQVDDLEAARVACSCPSDAIWDIFKLIQPHLCLTHKETPLRSRLKQLKRYGSVDIEVMKFVLDPDRTVDPALACDKEETGYSLIHTVAKQPARLHMYDRPGGMTNVGQEDVNNWISFCSDVIRRTKGDPLH